MNIPKTTSHKDVFIVDAQWSDVIMVADKMRVSDREEILASNGYAPEEALEKGFDQSSVCKTVVYKGSPIAMFGVVPYEGDKACLWLLGTDALDQVHVCFGRMSKKIIEQFLQVYPYLYNYVDARNEKTIAWLEWCGAKFSEAEPYGVAQIMFKHFVFQRHAAVAHV